MNRLYKEEFINFFKSFHPAARVVSGRRQLLMRCKFCGDSKDPKHAHLYVKVPQSPDEISMYQCKKCPAHGIVDNEFLRFYGCYDSQMLEEYSQNLKATMSSPKYAALRISMGRKLYNTWISNRPTNEAKLAYINNRIGANFTYGHLSLLKIFLNLNDVLRSNNLKPTMNDWDISELDTHFIGFIGYDNTRAILRRYDNSVSGNWMKDLRYVNYNFIHHDDAKCFYVIPTTIDMENLQPTEIHVTEGVFDILSVFYNLHQCNTKQIVYISASGKSYKQAIEYLLTRIGLIEYSIHIYPDNDISDQELKYVIRSIEMLPSDIYIHRNTCPHQKDFGVPKNLIREVVTRYNEKTL